MKQEQSTVTDLLPQIYHHLNVVVRSAAKEVMEELIKGKSKSEPNIDEEFLSAEQAASFLKLQTNTIYKMREKGELPFYRIGKRKLLFSKKELEKHIANKKVKSNDEINDDIESYNGRKK